MRSYGTEGRRPGGEVAASSQVFECIMFRGSDIKDLQVIQQQQQPVKKSDLPDDPAIVRATPVAFSSSSQQQQQPKPVQQQKPSKTLSDAPGTVPQPAGTHQPAKKPSQNQAHDTRSKSKNNNNVQVKEKPDKDQPRKQQQSKERSRSKQRERPPHQPQSKGLEVPKTDFDFTNATLDKAQIVQEIKEKNDDGGANGGILAQLANMSLSQGTFYDKKTSFFDSISSEISERTAAKQNPAPQYFWFYHCVSSRL